MSTEQTRPETSDARGGVAPAIRAMAIWVCVCALVGLGVLFATGEMLIAVFGMIPTAAAAFADTTPRRLLTQCVGAMNFAGVSAVMALAWNDGGTINAAVNLLLDPYSWLVMLVGAAVGWSLTWAGRVVAARMIAHLVDRQVQQLRDYQAKLVADWGRRVLDENQ